jgi:hypothetical protein
MLENGDILVFNNGRDRHYSSVIQWDPKTNTETWRYVSESYFDFYAYVQGAAQRLENGNTLVTNSLAAHVFEVNPEGEMVFEFISPLVVQSPERTRPWASIYLATKYGQREFDWQKLGVDCW